ncbi:MAG: oxidoreductase, partial [Acidimicrobiales bacterium]|nr:oxidoreductase [Acidimicrobiales bacterium]
RLMFRLMSVSPMVQSAEKGSYPEVMCATEPELDLRALYGPTGWNEWVGPVGKGTLEPFAYEKPVMERLWELSEKETGYTWKL